MPNRGDGIGGRGVSPHPSDSEKAGVRLRGAGLALAGSAGRHAFA